MRDRETPPPARTPVPAEIAEALAAVGLQARAAQAITMIATPLQPRAVYRIALVSGETIKARRLEDAATARELCALRAALPPAFVPVLALHGRVLLEPWIEGTELRGVPPEPATVRAAGAQLAALHATTTAAGRPVRATQPTQAWREFGERTCATIAGRSAVAAPVLQRVRGLQADRDPGHAVYGLVHTDFCGDNFVVDARGTLHVIDNERISVDALGYDLGRTWVRWRLGTADWERFAAAYAAHGGPAAALDALAFWRLMASLSALSTRLKYGLPDPVRTARLDEILAEAP